LEALEAHACPGAGACGGQFTPTPWPCRRRFGHCTDQAIGRTRNSTGQARRHTRGWTHADGNAVAAPTGRPSQIITRKSLENAIASVAASGGSTNAVLHLLAIARELKHSAYH